MFASQVPLFLSILFLVVFLIPILLISSLVKGTSQAGKQTRIIIFYISYLVLVGIACFQGAFDVVSLPPRIVLVTTLPLLLFYLLIISNTAFYTNTLKEVALSRLVEVHIFRLIGSFFIILFFLELLPQTFGLIAGIGDMITALGSLYVARTIRKNQNYAKHLTLFWNSFGLLDILLTSAMAILFTKKNIETGSMGVDILTQFPFCFIPAFAPATIIFLHVSIYRKIFSKKF